jgi:hypothetical protein
MPWCFEIEFQAGFRLSVDCAGIDLLVTAFPGRRRVSTDSASRLRL